MTFAEIKDTTTWSAHWHNQTRETNFIRRIHLNFKNRFRDDKIQEFMLAITRTHTQTIKGTISSNNFRGVISITSIRTLHSRIKIIDTSLTNKDIFILPPTVIEFIQRAREHMSENSNNASTFADHHKLPSKPEMNHRGEAKAITSRDEVSNFEFPNMQKSQGDSEK
jgi:hypothetical protein